VRGGDHKHTRANIEKAVEDSLRRLKCECIDLYQLHWPDRKSNYFGRLGYGHVADDDFTPLIETLEGLSALVEAGKIRAVGVSNETPWGLMKYLSLDGAGPRIASIQNPYSLVNRVFEIGLAEVSVREDCGLLGYSPLAFGALSGKYLGGARPEGARYTLFPEYARYFQARPQAATESYVALARDHGLDPSQMALAYAASRPFMTSVIIGVTSVEQLACNLASLDLTLSEDVLEGIEAIHAADPNPAT
jgi:aryl-alcohol dehydrogenase-like predicted oxidoreductase